MRALSLWQPWASLCVPLAPGEPPVKRIETRSWSTSYRGSLAIHAAKATAHFDGAREGGWNYLYVGDYEAGWCARTSDEGTRGHTCMTGPGVEIEDQYRTMPLGVVLGTVDVVDVVPIVEVAPEARATDIGRVVSVAGSSAALYDGEANAVLVTDQIPYGDFSTEGKQRYAWIFEDAKLTTEECPACEGVGWSSWRCRHCNIVWTDVDDLQQVQPDGHYACPTCLHDDLEGSLCLTCDGKGTCPPISAKGHQGIWNWTP